MCWAREAAKTRRKAEQNSRKKSTEENQRSLTCLRVGVEGLEFQSETREKITTVENLTPNPTLTTPEELVIWINVKFSSDEISRLVSLLSGDQVG